MKIFRSIRWRLLVWYGVLLFLIVTGLGIISYRHEQAAQLRTIDQSLQSRVALLATALKPGNHNRQGRSSSNDRSSSHDGNHDPDDGIRPGEGGTREQNPGKESQDSAAGLSPTRTKTGKTLQLTADEITQFVGTEGFYYAAQPKNGSPTYSSNAPEGLTLPDDERGGGIRTRGLYREAFLFPGKGDCVLAGISLAGHEAAMRNYLGLLVALGTLVLAIALTGGWVLTNRALRPISSITLAAVKIMEGDHSRRINVNETESELGLLANLLNTTFARLEATINEQARFTADAAHELRTPVAVILIHAQSALAEGGLNPEQREAIEACEQTAQRMRRIVESLLQLARLEAGSVPKKRVDLGEVAAEAVESLRILAGTRRVTLAMKPATAEIRGDAVQLGQIVTNLVGNAIHHGREGGQVQVTVRNEEGCAVLVVADDGPGIAAKHLPHVFDRFYRGDEARTGTAGRTGLGLAITKALVEAHGGEITAQNEKGATFIVRLPRT